MMVGPLTLIRPNLRAHFALVFATNLPETDLFCWVMEIDVGRRGNIMLLDFGLRKRRWIGRGRLTDGNFKKARRMLAGSSVPVNNNSRKAKVFLVLELTAALGFERALDLHDASC